MSFTRGHCCSSSYALGMPVPQCEVNNAKQLQSTDQLTYRSNQGTQLGSSWQMPKVLRSAVELSSAGLTVQSSDHQN